MSRNAYYKKLISSRRWKVLRAKKLKASPLCEKCKERGYIVQAVEVHHITPVESVTGKHQMKVLMFQYGNLMSLCHSCHSDIHRKMFSHSKSAVKENRKRIVKSFVDKFLK